jgi:hypothetical protein
MRLFFGLILSLTLLGSPTSVVAQTTTTPTMECEGEIKIYRDIKIIVLGVGCKVPALTEEEAFSVGRMMLIESGLSEYDTLYSATPLLPESDGTTNVWALMIIDPE